MDSTANELESVAIDGFPTLKYFPAGGKEVDTHTHTHTHTHTQTQQPTTHTLRTDCRRLFFSQVINYTGKRDLETFSKFLDNGGVLPKDESDEDENEGGEDGDEVPDSEEEDDTGDDSKVCLCCYLNIPPLSAP